MTFTELLVVVMSEALGAFGTRAHLMVKKGLNVPKPYLFKA